MLSRVCQLILIFLLQVIIFPKEKIGNVAYHSSQFVYVKFDNTDGIDKNDTLYVLNDKMLLPVLVSTYVSSRSCACVQISDYQLNPEDEIIAIVSESYPAASNESVETLKENISGNNSVIKETEINKSKKIETVSEKDKLRFSIQSYSTLSNIQDITDRQQWRYLLASEIHQIGNKPLSFSTYFTYRHRPGDASRNSFSKSLNVYDLSLKYEFTNGFDLVLGRNINRNISNISSIDGLQFNKKWKVTTAGLVIGSRPDLNFSSGVNFNLFETGVYIARKDSLLKGATENTLAVFEQTNSFKTDRRFIYLQHSNNMFNDIYTFLSAEIDLYSKENGKAKNTFNLMSLYLLSRYNLSRNLSLSLSYDNRKNVIYYESFRNLIDSLIDRETRQGIRAGLDIRPYKQVFITINGGYNYKKSDFKPARNILAGISFTNIPVLNINTYLNYTAFENSYITGNVYGVRLSKELLEGKLFPSIGYRRSDYDINFGGTSVQNFLSADLSVKLINKLFLSLNYEFEFDNRASYNRLLIDLSTRL